MQHDLAYTRRLSFQIDYGREIEQEIVQVQTLIEKYPALNEAYPSRWLALKLLENDKQIAAQIALQPDGAQLISDVQKNIHHLVSIFGEDVDTLIADRRYGWINGLVRETMQVENSQRRTLTDRIDDVVTNRILGIPIFLLLMWGMFKITTDLSAPLLDWVNAVLEGPVTHWVSSLVMLLGLNGNWVESLLLDGVVAGLGGLLAFVPVLMALYGALAILEDSGYMARAAFVMDRFMHVLGLHGKSFLPLIVGFGCSVPGIFATRTLENEKDRILTAMMVPFMSCGARLPVYVLIAGIFFPEKAGLMVFWMYLIGIVMAITAGLLLKNTLFRRRAESPFVLELPPYRIPTLKAIWIHMWEHTSSFIKKAGSLILSMSLVIWLLLAIPVGGEGRFANVDLQSSAYAAISGKLAPLLSPAGFGSWQTSGALISGIAAKEVIVTSLTQVYGMDTPVQDTAQTSFVEDVSSILTGFVKALWEMVLSIPRLIGIDLTGSDKTATETALAPAVRAGFEQTSGGHAGLAAFAFMVFILIYTPCIATLAALRKELGTRWMLLSAFGQLAAAWLLAVIVFQGGMLLGLG
ncbi:MAG: ferrous iron transport protein B [Chloroflexi bacterium]|nr:ferrous iron transport protein B [Chloroflexota bacterium]